MINMCFLYKYLLFKYILIFYELGIEVYELEGL